MNLPAKKTNSIEAVLNTFKTAGWELQPVFKWKETAPSIWCNYKATLRPIHPDVCQWHQDRRDPECIGCVRNTNKKFRVLKKPRISKKKPSTQRSLFK